MAHEEYIRTVPGSDTAVLMIHGILGTPDHFRDLLPLVPENWTVHNLLLDGHGGSVEAFAATSMKRWKTQVNTCLDGLLASHDRVLIVAHSMGTLFAFQAALRCPDRISHLFLLGTPLRVFVRPSTAVNAVKLTFGFLDQNNRSAVDMQRGLSVRPDPWLHKYLFWIPRFLELFAEIWKTRKLLPQITVPTQVFQSKNDELVHFSSRHDLVGYPAITCTPLYDSGHFGYGDGDLKMLQDRFRGVIFKMQAAS